jgi:polysaccharide pyruvyl transferase WcaK-like protein
MKKNVGVTHDTIFNLNHSVCNATEHDVEQETGTIAKALSCTYEHHDNFWM